MTSLCFTKEERKEYDHLIMGKKGVRSKVLWFHDHGYGNAGVTSGHLVPGYERVLKVGWKGIYADLKSRLEALSEKGRKSSMEAQLRAMKTAAKMPKRDGREVRRAV